MYIVMCTIFHFRRTGTCAFNAVRMIISRSLCSGGSSNEWQNVLDYWFGPGAQSKWCNAGPQVDEEIRKKFGFMVSVFTFLDCCGVRESRRRGGVPTHLSGEIFGICNTAGIKVVEAATASKEWKY